MPQWTVLIYMAGDAGAYFPGPIGDTPLVADVSRALQADLARLKAAGASEQVGVCVQFDSLRAGQAFRWVVPSEGPSRAGEVGAGVAGAAALATPAPQPIGATNTGEPASLTDFMGWAASARPADRYAVIIWGHGSGWSETDIYARYRGAQAATRDASPGKAAMLRRGIFATSAAEIMAIEDDRTRGLCYDDSARDFLDNAELRRGLKDGAALMGRDKVDVVGLDACLMTMIEVAEELRDAADTLAGSETVLPQDFWPWGDLLGALQLRPEMSAREVALLMGGSLPGDARTRAFVDVCQSALDLGRAGAATEAAAEWGRAARALLPRDAALRRAFAAAREGALRLSIPREGETDYVDLLDLLRVLWREWDLSEAETLLRGPEDGRVGGAGDFRRATRALLTAIWPEGEGSLVMGRRTEGFRGRAAPGGLSVYLPRAGREWSPLYERLAFARTGWAEVWRDARGG
jgi:hypothetical protein